MTKKEILKYLSENKKVKNKTWDEDEYIYFTGTTFRDEDNNIVNFGSSDISRDGWEVYKEPKKKVTMYKFAVIENDGDIFESYSFHEDKEGYLSKNPNIDKDKLKRLDYTATEFEMEN